MELELEDPKKNRKKTKTKIVHQNLEKKSYALHYLMILFSAAIAVYYFFL